MNKYTIYFLAMISVLPISFVLVLYQHQRLTAGGFTTSPEAIATLPLIVGADISLLAFWGLMLVFRINELSSQRVELLRNLWEIGFKRDELKVRIAEVKGNKQKEESLMILYNELENDAITRKESIDAFYEWETQITYVGLLAAMFFVLSLSFGVYGISATFHTELLDPFTYYTPIICLFAGVVTTIFALLSSSFRIVKSLEIR